MLKNGGSWLRNLDEVIEFLNQGSDSKSIDETNSQKYMDCFISYGRTMSKSLSKDLVTHFKNHSFDYWIDDNLSALGPEKIEFINGQIRSAGNFIFVISPQSVKSEICLRELEFAVENNKTILVIHHIPPQGDWEKARLILKDYKWYYFDENAIDQILNELNPEITKNKERKLLYSELLIKSVMWFKNGKHEDDLLYGQDRIKYSKWTTLQHEGKIILNELQNDYLQESLNQFFFTRLINKSAQKIEFITENKSFEPAVSLIALLNPLAIIPQLISVLNDSMGGLKSSGVSALTFVIFLLINISLLLVWIKQRNKNMVASTVLSILLITAIVILLILQ